MTGIETVLALVALTVMSALYVPASSEPVAAVAVIDLVPVPEVEERLNQAALSLTVHAPVELMAMVWVAGLAAPSVAE